MGKDLGGFKSGKAINNKRFVVALALVALAAGLSACSKFEPQKKDSGQALPAPTADPAKGAATDAQKKEAQKKEAEKKAGDAQTAGSDPSAVTTGSGATSDEAADRAVQAAVEEELRKAAASAPASDGSPATKSLGDATTNQGNSAESPATDKAPDQAAQSASAAQGSSGEISQSSKREFLVKAYESYIRVSFQIMRQRMALLETQAQLDKNVTIATERAEWLVKMRTAYEMNAGQGMAELLDKVDIVPFEVMTSPYALKMKWSVGDAPSDEDFGRFLKAVNTGSSQRAKDVREFRRIEIRNRGEGVKRPNPLTDEDRLSMMLRILFDPKESDSLVATALEIRKIMAEKPTVAEGQISDNPFEALRRNIQKSLDRSYPYSGQFKRAESDVSVTSADATQDKQEGASPAAAPASAASAPASAASR